MGEVINFHKTPEVLKEIKELWEENRISDLAIIYRVPHKTDEERKKFRGSARIIHHWFGDESSIMCLGLVRHLADLVADFIRETYDTLDD